MKVSTVALSTTAAKVYDAAACSAGRSCAVKIKNVDAAITVYWGGPDVNTTTKGEPLAPGESQTFEVNNTADHIYMVAASGAPNVRMVESGRSN